MRYLYRVTVGFEHRDADYTVEAGSVGRAFVLGTKVARREHRERDNARARKPRIMAIREVGSVAARD